MLELKNISKSYNNYIILNNINISVRKKEIIAITGPSGSGKSTLLNIMGLLERPDTGHILYKGILINHKSHQSSLLMRHTISYLFQNFALVDSMTVYDNLLIGLKYTQYNKKEKKKLIEESLLKVGLQNMSNRKIYTLSGGEQQRTALARILLKESQIILCDEPTGSLDPINSQMILQLLFQCRQQGKTIVIVTHDPKIASQCDRIINIHK
ncbi:putative bacteriocin export ABC transporter [Eggerthia catenaformis]|uniref:putative bacteriocin export ABC transporter n=1 Tax=Eggerthia catenaformis TaxID=31973 RepID=UPI0028EC1751|nr:putative bacteriocin export ABC transporter [Eggerthia catenaformis]